MTTFPRHVSRDRRLSRRHGLLLPAITTGLFLAAGCGGADDPDHAAPDDEPMEMEVTDLLSGADMAELSQASDVVVRGTVTEAEAGLRIGEDRIRYTAFTVEVAEALAGDPGGPGDRLRMVFTSHVGQQAIEMEGRPMPQVGDEGIWFLTRIDPQFGYDGYVLTGQAGELLLDGDRVVGGGPADLPVGTEVDRLGSPEAVVDHVRDVAG
jgi:hypothetical protein